MSERTPISPLTDPLRFTADEANRWQRGECGYQTAYGLPWDEYCTEPSEPGADFGYCARHDRQVREEGS